MKLKGSKLLKAGMLQGMGIGILFSPVARGEILLTFSEESGAVSLVVSGSWDTWNRIRDNDIDLLNPYLINGITPDTGGEGVILALPRETVDYGDSSETSLLSNLPVVPWSGNFEGVSFSGDEFGFSSFELFGTNSSFDRVAPKDYVAGEAISATAQFESSFSEMGLTPSSSGVIDIVSLGGPENISWVTLNAIPEPSGILLCLLGGLSGLFVRRR